MAEFKLVIGDPKTGKCFQIVVSEDNAGSFIGKKIGDKVRGESFDYPGYELEITGGADYCGFPMRKDIEGPVRKKILLVKGIGIRNKEKGIKKRKTVCGNTIHDKITQISMKILKYGKKSFGEPAEEQSEKEKPADKPKEEVKKEVKEKPMKGEKKEEPVTEKAESKEKETKKEKPKERDKPVKEEKK